MTVIAKKTANLLKSLTEIYAQTTKILSLWAAVNVICIELKCLTSRMLKLSYISFNVSYSSETFVVFGCSVEFESINFISVSSLLGINAVELRDALTTNSNVTRGEEKNRVLETKRAASFDTYRPFKVMPFPVKNLPYLPFWS